MVKKFQNRNRIVIVLLLILFLTGSCIQIFKPDVHTSFSCITIIAIMYYTYFNDLWQQVDGMTGLFLHQAYIQRAARLKVNEAIIIMDCDDFKEINDTYGHQTGDECLITITNAIKSTYQNDGICYRIGGDEFAIIIFKSELIGELNSTFLEKLSLERAKNPLLPFVSLGTAIYHEQDDPNQVRDIADKMMYQHKLRSKVASDELENK